VSWVRMSKSMRNHLARAMLNSSYCSRMICRKGAIRLSDLVDCTPNSLNLCRIRENQDMFTVHTPGMALNAESMLRLDGD